MVPRGDNLVDPLLDLRVKGKGVVYGGLPRYLSPRHTRRVVKKKGCLDIRGSKAKNVRSDSGVIRGIKALTREK